MTSPQPEPKPSFTMRVVSSSRYIIWLAVICTFVGSMTLMIMGTLEMFYGIWTALTHLSEAQGNHLKIVLIESVDSFLVATVIFLISLGLYQLFVNDDIQLPGWLNTRSVEELEKRLAGLIVIVMAVIFLTQVIQWNGEITILWLGLAVGVVILAISVFLYQESRDHTNQ
jgi:uncharacterized membrane protein YqhA